MTHGRGGTVASTSNAARSGRIEARSGLRMMPTFPRSLSFRKAGFPRYGCKAGLSDGAFPAVASLKSAPDMRVATAGLHPPFVHSAARAGSPFLPGPQARSCTAMKWLAPHPQGPPLETGLFCPGPSSLNRPHPPHAATAISPHGGLYAMPSLCGSAEATRARFRAFAAYSFLTCRPLRLPGSSTSRHELGQSLAPTPSRMRRYA
jgi:hypothetical protein